MCRGHTQAFHTHDAIAEATMLMKEAVDDIMVTLNEAASEVGMVGGMVDSITEAMAKVRCCYTHTHTRALLISILVQIIS